MQRIHQFNLRIYKACQQMQIIMNNPNPHNHMADLSLIWNETQNILHEFNQIWHTTKLCCNKPCRYFNNKYGCIYSDTDCAYQHRSLTSTHTTPQSSPHAQLQQQRDQSRTHQSAPAPHTLEQILTTTKWKKSAKSQSGQKRNRRKRSKMRIHKLTHSKSKSKSKSRPKSKSNSKSNSKSKSNARTCTNDSNNNREEEKYEYEPILHRNDTHTHCKNNNKDVTIVTSVPITLQHNNEIEEKMNSINNENKNINYNRNNNNNNNNNKIIIDGCLINIYRINFTSTLLRLNDAIKSWTIRTQADLQMWEQQLSKHQFKHFNNKYPKYIDISRTGNMYITQPGLGRDYIYVGKDGTTSEDNLRVFTQKIKQLREQSIRNNENIRMRNEAKSKRLIDTLRSQVQSLPTPLQPTLKPTISSNNNNNNINKNTNQKYSIKYKRPNYDHIKFFEIQRLHSEQDSATLRFTSNNAVKKFKYKLPQPIRKYVKNQEVTYVDIGLDSIRIRQPTQNRHLILNSNGEIKVEIDTYTEYDST